MAEDSQPAASILPTSSSSADGCSTISAARKLRDSCHACASSKLKCSKEKPICSRCASRNITCKYVATRRGGRRPRRRWKFGNRGGDDNFDTVTVADNRGQLRSLSSWSNISTVATGSGLDLLPLPGTSQLTPHTEVFTTSSNLFTQADSAIPLGVADFSASLTDRSVPHKSFVMPQSSGADILGQTDLSLMDIDMSGQPSDTIFDKLLFFEDSASNSISSPKISPCLSQTSTPAGDLYRYHESHTSRWSCSCLVRALGLLKDLLPETPQSYSTSIPHRPDGSTTMSVVETVIAKNGATIKIVSSMLNCPCSQDDYSLTIMALLLFKMLSRYAMAARETPCSFNSVKVPSPPVYHPNLAPYSRETRSAVNNYSFDSEQPACMDAQLLLRELHGVRCLIDQLSLKLNLQAAKSGGQFDTSSLLQYNGEFDAEIVPPLSTVMLDQVDIDLRQRLKALTEKILNVQEDARSRL